MEWFFIVSRASIFFQWINGIKVVEHQIGHLPFEAEISEQLKFGAENRITVLVGEQFCYLLTVPCN